MKAFWKIKKGGSVLGSWFLSYMLVLFVILTLVVMTELTYTDIIVDEIVEKKYIEVESFKDSMDEITEEQRYFTLNLSENSIIKEIATKDVMSDRGRMEIREFLKNTTAHMAAVDEFFIYLKNDGILINSNGYIDYPERLYEAYYKNSNSTFDEWKENLLERKFAGYYPIEVQSDARTERVQLCYSLPLKQLNGSNITLISVVDTHKYAAKINDFVKKGELSLLTYDDNGNVFFKLGKNIPDKEQIDFAEKSDKFFESRVGNDEVVICRVYSDVSGWRYIFSMSKDMFWSRLFLVNMVSVVAIILILILGIAGIYLAVKRNYREVSDIVSRIVKEIDSGDIDSTDEFKIIDSVLDVATKLKNELRVKEERVRNGRVCSLLTGIGDEDLKNKLYNDCKRMFASNNFIAVIFNLNVYESLFEDEDVSREEKMKCMIFIIDNIVEELISPFGTVDAVESNNIIFLFSPYAEYTYDANRIIKEKMQEAIYFVKEQFGVGVECGISGVQKEMSSICNAYNEAKAALRYALVDDNQYVYVYNAGDTNNDDVSITAQQEAEIITSLTNGDLDNVIRQTDSIFNGIKSSYPNADISAIYSEMTEIIYKVAMNTGYAFELPSVNGNVTSMESITDMCRKLCDYQRTGNNGIEERTVRQINDIIEENYTDVNLNVAMIAKIMDMNVNYLSGLYKKKTNMNILNKIQQRRLQKAIELLHKEEYSIEKVSHETGFGSTVTFNRVFKKYIGMPPGKYRETRFSK